MQHRPPPARDRLFCWRGAPRHDDPPEHLCARGVAGQFDIDNLFLLVGSAKIAEQMRGQNRGAVGIKPVRREDIGLHGVTAGPGAAQQIFLRPIGLASCRSTDARQLR